MRLVFLATSIGLVLFALRLPVMLRQHAAQDEDFFVPPGWTILNDGWARIPYMPSRDRESHFYRADEGFFILPPLFFYWEAAFFAVLGPSTGAGRVASALAGVMAVALLALLGRRLAGEDRIGLLAAGLFAFSRCAYFPWLMCRPDALCGMWGFAALLAVLHGRDELRTRGAAWTGVFVGLGLLTHPFVVVYGVQCAIGVALRIKGGRQRLIGLGVFALAAAAMLACWLPLILQAPDLFQHQFIRHVFGQRGPGLVTRLLWPWPSLTVQWPIFLEHVRPLQATLMLAGLAFAGWDAIARRRNQPLFWITLTAIYLHVASVGPHPTKGYWAYTGGLMWLTVASAMWNLAISIQGRLRPVAWCGMIGVVLALMVPGSGLRTLAAHVRHWNDVNYDARRFARELLDVVPPGATVAVEPSYVFEFELAGRKPVLALEFAPFFRVSQQHAEYLVVGEYTVDDLPSVFGGKKIAELGTRADPFACFAEVWRKISD